ncbi:hypothetical protein [Fibrobacter sp.]|uniref:hypothetical protein n=1 Tax=Fibrobacter sp. TaxID=35828 RepID=UPI00386EB294
MNNKIYSLMALGVILFAAACSDNVSPISGSTSVPNMGNNLTPNSPVLCSVIGVTDSLEALEKGCIWSPEMWGPTSGYRVRTGFDNGTNTSGIWTVSTYPDNGNIVMEWPGNATTEYDSMALADVIDKCGGSLCGKVLFKGKNSIPESESYPNTRGEVYFDFYLAGKNASGKFESVDVRDMEGICVSYSGHFTKLQLIPDDSIEALMGDVKYHRHLTITDSNTLEDCFSWDEFYFTSPGGGSAEMFYQWSIGIITHLKGFRFVLDGGDGEDYYEDEFKIAGISRHNTAKVPTNNLHPVRTDCEPVAVMKSFCECEYSDDKISLYSEDSVAIGYHFFSRFWDALLSSDSVTNDCLMISLSNLKPFIEKPWIQEKPCDNPLPEYIMCSDSTFSESIEYTEITTEFNNKIESITPDARAIADSLIDHCLSLSN